MLKKLKNSYFSRITLSIYIIIINYLAFMPVNNVGLNSDKVNHILSFTLLTLLVYASFNINLLAIFISGVSFGIYIEFIQSFIPYRSAEYLDLVADVVGIFFGIIVIYFIHKREKCVK